MPQIGFLLNPMSQFEPRDDTSYALMCECARRGADIYVFHHEDVIAQTHRLCASVRPIEVTPPVAYTIGQQRYMDLAKHLDAIIIRTEPPVDDRYMYTLMMLDLIEPHLVWLNSPRGILTANEKLYILRFPEMIPPTIVSAQPKQLRAFQDDEGGTVVLKTLDSMGGSGVLLLDQAMDDLDEQLERVTNGGRQPIMAQRFLPAIASGDKRVFLVNGEPIGCLNRIPPAGDFRANIHVGATIAGAELTERDRQVCRHIKEQLQRDGLGFAGIDLIDGMLVEINVTSPAGIPEANQFLDTPLETQIVDYFWGQLP